MGCEMPADKLVIIGKAFLSLLEVSLKGVCHKIFGVLFWHVWIDLGLYKNLWLL